MMTTTQIFPLGGSYVSGPAPVTTRGSYAGTSGTATIGTYVSTGVERGHIPGRYTDTAHRDVSRDVSRVGTAGPVPCRDGAEPLL